ncbi:hypothetical protein [Amycolatopsis sp. NPDC051903]|uniref:hypothetical protein n=1 Tax=Amycolatopsis sp. NPDC051903 TaxID=3363936 RepID=UPI0037AC8FE9
MPGQEADQVREHALFETSADKTGAHLGRLFDTDPRPDSPRALRAAGWTVTSSPVAEFTARYGRGPDPGVDDPIRRTRFVFGEKVC